MSTLKIYIRETSFYFSISSDVSGKEYVSSDVILADMLWKIKIVKGSTDDDEIMNIFLICASKHQNEKFNWICKAEAIITLHSVQFQRALYQKSLPRYEFTHRQLCSPPLAFIKYSDSKQYVQNGRLVFEVFLLVEPVRYIMQSDIEQTRTIFSFTVEDVSELETKYSRKVILRGTEFNVMVRRTGDKLGVFVCDERHSRNKNWTWNVNISIKLLSFDENVAAVTKIYKAAFYYDLFDLGYSHFMDWNRFVDPSNKYVQNNRAIFEIDLEIEPPKPILGLDHKSSKNSALECSICLQSIIGREPNSTKCGHLFCGCCIKRWIQEHQNCPLCNANADLTELRPIFI